MRSKKLERVTWFGEPREHEHGGARMLGADLSGGSQALVNVGWRHADVHERDVGS